MRDKMRDDSEARKSSGAMTGTILDYLDHNPENGTDENDRTRGAFKPGKTADHPLGIGYLAPWEDPADGFCEHSRRNARALAMAGMPVHLRSVDPTIAYRFDDEAMAIEKLLAPLLNASIARYAAQVYQVVPTDQLIFHILSHRHLNEDELRAVNSRRVLYTVWERENMAPETAQAMNHAGQLWVACHANADMLERSGIPREKIRVVPVPYFGDDPHLALRGRARTGTVTFYHIGKWEPRKAQDRIFGAFMLAFRPGEANLIMKTSPFAPNCEGYPATADVAMRQWLLDERVRKNGWTPANARLSIAVLSTNRLSDAQMVSLHERSDVYVSLSRGEGFDMPAFDAKLSGNALVYTPSGGPQDFAEPVDFIVERTGSVACHPFYRWNKDATYLDFDTDAAVDALRRAKKWLEFPPGGMKRAATSPDMRRFSAATVGAEMAKNLREMGVEI